MSENTPSSDNGGLNDPLKLRNTDTGTLKRVPAGNSVHSLFRREKNN